MGIYSKLSQTEPPLTITFLKPKSSISQPNVMAAVKSESEDNATPEPPRAPSNAPPADSPKSMDNNSVPAPKPPSADQETSHENLVPVTPGGPDDDFVTKDESEEEEEAEAVDHNIVDDPVSVQPQALLDAFDDD